VGKPAAQAPAEATAQAGPRTWCQKLNPKSNEAARSAKIGRMKALTTNLNKARWPSVY